MYIIISYDMRTRSVAVHGLSSDLNKSINRYNEVVKENYIYNSFEENCKIIELVEIDDEFYDLDGYQLYWTNDNNKKRILCNIEDLISQVDDEEDDI